MDVGSELINMGLSLFEPLQRLAGDPDAAAALVKIVGWDLGSIAGLGTGDLEAAASAIAEALKSLPGGLETSKGADFLKVAGALSGIAEAAVTLRSFGSGWNPADGLPADLPAKLIQDVFAQLLVLYLDNHHQALRAGLDLLGILTYAKSSPLLGAGGAVVRSGDARPQLDLSVLGRLFSDPGAVVKDRLGLGAERRPADQVADDIFPTVAALFRSAGLSAWYGDPGGHDSAQLTEEQRGILQHLLRLVWIQDLTLDPAETAGLDLALALVDDGPKRTLVVYPSGFLHYALDEPTWNANVTLSGTLGGLTIGSEGVQFSDSANPGIHLAATLGHPATGYGLIRLGAADSLRFEVAGADLAVKVTLATTGADLQVDAALQGVRFVIAAPGGDGFLSHCLPAGGVNASFDIAASWSRSTGLRFGGSVGLNATIPLNAQLGPIRLIAAQLSLRGTTDGVTARAATDLALQLGPFSAVVQGLGLTARLTAQSNGGNLGPVNIDIGIAPPRAIGLAINTPTVSGGGFLLFDPDAGRYAGVFELTILGTVSVKAVALINTKLADGSPGFALLIMITADGFTPIQLGMGFALTGIGGLLALNHTVDAGAVRGGLRDGVLDSILFVKDPVKNATRVLSTIDRVFPIAPDRLLIGPLAEISWGTPPLVKLRVALLLEVPQPIRVILLAGLAVLLPEPSDPVVELHVDAIGLLDLGRGELALDASLHDSRLLTFTLTGDMALRLNWGAEPMFVLSIGGFHPKFVPPKGLRPLSRLTLSLTDGANPRVRFETYLAVTSNTLQMGARVSVHAEADGFGFDGGGSFDALIQWSPFAVDVSFSAWVRVFGPTGTLLAVSVELDVTGPRPWHVTGHASVQLLFFSVTVRVDFTVGRAVGAGHPVDTFDVAAAIWAQLGDPAGWQAALPAGATPGVTLVGLPPPASGQPLVAHPHAVISVRQHVAPLDTPIERVGARIPAAGTRTYSVTATAPSGVVARTVTDLFAPGQYTDMPDDQRISEPSFVQLPAGISLTPVTAAAAGPALAYELAVRTLDVTGLDDPASPGPTVPVSAAGAAGIAPSSEKARILVTQT